MDQESRYVCVSPPHHLRSADTVFDDQESTRRMRTSKWPFNSPTTKVTTLPSRLTRPLRLELSCTDERTSFDRSARTAGDSSRRCERELTMFVPSVFPVSRAKLTLWTGAETLRTAHGCDESPQHLHPRFVDWKRLRSTLHGIEDADARRGISRALQRSSLLGESVVDLEHEWIECWRSILRNWFRNSLA